MAGKRATEKVGSVAMINTDTFSTAERWSFINYLDTGNITEGKIENIQQISDIKLLPSRARRKVQTGDIVYSTVRPNQKHYGFITAPLENMLVSTGFAVLRGVEGKCDTKFLYYFLTQQPVVEHLQTIAEHSTSAYPSIRPCDIESLDVDLPPLSEQRAIAHILGTLDDKIELNRRMNETLEGMAQAIFKSWFVDFDPVRAKCVGAHDRGVGAGLALPNYEGAASGAPTETILPKPIADLFPSEFQDSELGQIPKGWKIGAFGDVAHHPRRGVQPSDINPSTPYIALEHMPKRCIALSDWGVADGLESNKFEFKKGEILFGKLRPYFHKVGVAPLDGVCSTDIVVVAPRTEKWFGFVLGHVSSTEFVDFTNAGSTGTKMPRTNWGDMGRYAVVIPHDTIAEAFNM
jgi:type I restriction enzyme S subunit